MADTLSIGEVASKARLTRDTIRYYERLGLLPKPRRTPAGYRQYDESILTRLTLIRNAQRFGFSLRETAAFVHVRETGGKPCHDVRRAAERMLAAVDREIAELIATRKRMETTLALWDRKLDEAVDRPAYLLETPGPTEDARRDAHARRPFGGGR
jgi:DNA-binding transcriptional MerR regulator